MLSSPCALLVGAGWLLARSSAAPSPPLADRQADSWPYGPFVTSGTSMVNAQGQNITYAGVNWPGAADVMIPEGLQYQSIETIVDKIKSLGMNSIRLTYAIEMIDQIYDNDGVDIPLDTAFTDALGATNGPQVLDQVLANNPSFSASTTRVEVFEAVAAECARQQVYVHLDNHISRGEWCCNSGDGNSWWGDTYFDVDNWTRGLAYMADRGRDWTALTSMSLRNELREPTNDPDLAAESYNWEDWYMYVRQGADAIHDANADVLIFLSGLNFDTYLTPVVQGTALTPGSATFDPADFVGYADKLVLELHNYQSSASSCDDLSADLYDDGYQALHPDDAGAAHVFPVVLTEFGFSQDDTTWQGVYATCIASYLSEQRAGWFIWVLGGSYYIRSGEQDFDEYWGLLTHDWSDWRSPSYIDGGLTPLVQNTVQG